eukprot:TRINITY_DN3857_c0_g1_i5.p1 TRINITY_DN3857_c0_g1~~TRINITY_DN3857_c0_g1_i5.p1  ORF type:complete len:478 (+),score=87.90 TRINITY_DN3857_c0_g1_i5:199-1632(+)
MTSVIFYSFLFVGLVLSTEDFTFSLPLDYSTGPLPLNLVATNLATGGYSTSIITENANNIHSWGLEISKGEILEFPENLKNISCGGYCCTGLSEGGNVYEWGRIYGSGGKKIPPTLVHEFGTMKVIKISAGYDHNIAITDQGHVYSWGKIDEGKLGSVHHTQREISENYCRPKRILFSSDVFILDGACGADFTVLLDSEGALWSFGNNRNGQLGIGNSDVSFVREPQKISKILPKFGTIDCGGDHCLAVTLDGIVYSWGWGEKGALGHGRFTDEWEPKEIDLKEKIRSVGVGGYSHSILLSEDGEVYTFGWNEYRQLGHDFGEDIAVPTKVSGLEKISLIVGGGFKHTAVLSQHGKVFVFGDNSFGQLGPIQEEGRVVHETMKIPQNIHVSVFLPLPPFCCHWDPYFVQICMRKTDCHVRNPLMLKRFFSFFLFLPSFPFFFSPSFRFLFSSSFLLWSHQSPKPKSLLVGLVSKLGL